MAHGDARVGKWRENNRMEWVTSKRHMTAERRLARAVQTLQVDVHSSLASSRLNWRPHRFKRTRPFCRKTKSGFCACVFTFQTHSTCVSVAIASSYFAGNNCQTVSQKFCISLGLWRTRNDKLKGGTTYSDRLWAGARDFFILQNVQSLSGAHPALYRMCTLGKSGQFTT
jgi:hypothetical protein